MIETINANPEDESIVTLSQEISSVDPSLECSPDEQASLTTLETDLEDAAENIKISLDEVLEDLDGRNQNFDITLISSLFRTDRFNSII